MKRLFLQIASFLAISTAASAADSTMVRFDFASTADQSGTYETTLQQGAQIIEYAVSYTHLTLPTILLV